MKPYVLFALALLPLAGCQTIPSQQDIKVETLAKSTKSWDGSQLPRYPKGQPEVSVVRITIPPGVRLPLHKHPVANAGMLLEGQLQVITESGKTIDIKAGDALIEVVDRWHYGTNTGAKPAVILVVYAGVEGVPVTVKHPKCCQ